MLDERDQIIFEHLLANARTPNKQLARILSCSEATVIKRIRRLEREQYISRYDALVNWQAVPLTKIVYFLNIDEKNRSALKRIYAHTNVFAIFRVLGPANIQVWCFFRTRGQQRSLEKIIAPFLQKELHILELTFPPSAFFEIEPKPVPYVAHTNDVEWSAVDVAIMKHMAQGHARQSFYEMSRELKIPYDTVHYHGKRLLASGAIGKILAQQGMVKFGLVTSVLVMRFSSQAILEETMKNAAHSQRVNSIATCPDNTLMVLVSCVSQQDYLDTVRAITANVQTEMREMQQYYWTKVILNNRYPLEELLHKR